MTRPFVTVMARRFGMVLGLLVADSAVTMAQQVVALSMRGPRFLQAPSPKAKPVEIDIRSNQLLRQVVSVDIDRATVGDVLTAIERQTGVKFIYSRNTIAVDRAVRVRAKRITVAGALTEILIDAGVDVLLQGSHLALIARSPAAVWQTGTITGRVTDAKTGQAIAGVEVFLERSRWRTSSDTAGHYRLTEVDTGKYTLVTRRLGYAKQSRPVMVRDGRTDTLDLTLAPVATQLDELLTTATGQKRRVELGNDITTINADSVVRAEPIKNVTDLLIGRVPGLTAQRTSGAPGDPTRFRLRGPGSPRLSNDPIVIVDGIRIYAEQSSARSANLAGLEKDTARSAVSTYATPSPLDQIDPNSIEKIEVLKGPSAATLYGQDAANGVIVITTKRGKAGPPRWTFSAEHGQTRMAGEYPELLVRWGHQTFGGALAGLPIFCPLTNVTSEYEPCAGDSVVKFQLLSDPSTTVLDHGRRNATMLGVSGGSSTFTYAFTGRYSEDVGLPRLPDYEVARYQASTETTPPDWMRRPQRQTQWGVTSNIGTRLGNKVEVAFTTSLSRSVQQRSSLEGQLGTLMATYLDEASGNYYRYGRSAFGGPAIVRDSNQLVANYYERVTDQSTIFRNAANLTWRANSLFTFTTDAGLDVQQRVDQLFLPSRLISATDSGRLNDGHGSVVTTTLNFRGDIGELRLPAGARFRFAAGVGFNKSSIRDQNFQTIGLPDGTIPTPGTQITGVYQTLSDASIFRLYAEPRIGINGLWFTLQLPLHQQGTTDGSNTAAFWRNLKQQLKFPPTFNTSYVLSDKSFFPFKDLFQMFRVRATYGRAGRQPGPLDRFRLYKTPGAGWVDGNTVATTTLGSLGNTELRPERSTELEGGFDADLLDNRLSVTLTGYRKTTDDMIMLVPLPPSVFGDGQSIQRNIGNLRNTGLELKLTANLLQTGLVGFQTEFWVVQTRNVLLSLAPGVDPFYSTIDSARSSTDIVSGIRVAPGYPLFGRWAKPIAAYADGNGNGVLESSEIVYGDTAIYVGESTPNYTANIRPTLSFFNRTLSVSAGFDYEDGLSQVNGVIGNFTPFSVGRNIVGASLAEQLASTGAMYTTIQTVSTFRFNTLSINYTVPPTLARRIGAQNVTVAVHGTNLRLWTNYSGLDPNVNSYAVGNNVRDLGVLPQPRSWQVRINMTY